MEIQVIDTIDTSLVKPMLSLKSLARRSLG